MRISLIVSIPVVFLALAAFIFLSDYFTIRTIQVEVNEELDASEIKAMLYRQLEHPRFAFIKQDKLLFFNADESFALLSERFRFQSLVITKKYPSSLLVRGEGDRSLLVWYRDGIFSLIGERGNIIGAVDRTLISSLPLTALKQLKGINISDYEGQTAQGTNDDNEIPPLVLDKNIQSSAYQSGDSVIEAIDVAFLTSLPLLLRESGMDMAYVQYEKGDRIISVRMKDGWELLLVLDNTLARQISQVGAVLAEKVRDDRTRLKMIDARFDNRIYYIFK